MKKRTTALVQRSTVGRPTLVHRRRYCTSLARSSRLGARRLSIAATQVTAPVMPVVIERGIPSLKSGIELEYLQFVFCLIAAETYRKPL